MITPGVIVFVMHDGDGAVSDDSISVMMMMIHDSFSFMMMILPAMTMTVLHESRSIRI